MAVGTHEAPSLTTLTRFVLISQDAQRLAAFYERALGCRVQGPHRPYARTLQRLGLDGDAIALTLALGDQTIDILQCDRPGRAYPADASSTDAMFQHFAIVVADIDQAYRRLAATEGWRAISTDGPQRLPDSSGGVTAFKFRDPDGHPLELLAFPQDRVPAHWRGRAHSGNCLGIDHSAIGVIDVERSLAFYQALGFRVVARSLNHGPEQSRLDDVIEPQVDVVALAAAHPTPHLELLSYRNADRAPADAVAANDVAATRLVFAADDPHGAHHLVDPDGHRLVIDPEPDASQGDDDDRPL